MLPAWRPTRAQVGSHLSSLDQVTPRLTVLLRCTDALDVSQTPTNASNLAQALTSPSRHQPPPTRTQPTSSIKMGVIRIKSSDQYKDAVRCPPLPSPCHVPTKPPEVPDHRLGRLRDRVHRALGRALVRPSFRLPYPPLLANQDGARSGRPSVPSLPRSPLRQSTPGSSSTRLT